MSDELLPPPSVDATKCVGYGLCHDYASRYLEMDDDGITRVRGAAGGVAASDAESIERAVAVCPAQAITWPGRLVDSG
ncbi:hypothetical protein GCM10023321_13720 [Pseudonocardia eucalypti]|uniref:Ferredoxin n=1 Tax=Pseudonocardia eucalypti TaxID=648755 RepID=A0ABP9PNJ8_9PSEU|nr:ferredoxin [Pseudonocardia eucalypti]